MFEINSKPKKITIQVKSKNGLWTTLTKMESKIRHFTFNEIKTILDAYISLYDSGTLIRIINEWNKTILSTRSVEFCENMNAHDLITVKYTDNEDPKMFIKTHNNVIPNTRMFQRYVASHGGILKWQPYHVDSSDNYLICGRLTLCDNTKLTVAFH